ncbi:MAG: hypothetical protein RLZZ499_3411 [Cyanobacteriota bacterium]
MPLVIFIFISSVISYLIGWTVETVEKRILLNDSKAKRELKDEEQDYIMINVPNGLWNYSRKRLSEKK